MKTTSTNTIGYQERQNASQVLPSSGIANSDVSSETKPSVACRWENTGDGASPNVGNHAVFVLSREGKALSPTTAAKARKLLRGEQAKKVWSKFNTFGIQLLHSVREEVPDTTIGYDCGTKFEGISVVVGNENNLSVKLNLPNKSKIVKKMLERKFLRRARRFRNCRRRQPRFQNRRKDGFIAPSQLVLVSSRIKVLREFCRIYPVQNVAIEDIKFNHKKHRWGASFSTMEIGKQRIEDFFISLGIQVFKYKGFETAEIRKKYGYKKTKIKSADKFSAHCSDSLALATDVNCGEFVEPGRFLVVDDVYRHLKRRLHLQCFAKGGIRQKYYGGTTKHIGKGIIIGATTGKTGQLCGVLRGYFRYYGSDWKRHTTIRLLWINNQFKLKEV